MSASGLRVETRGAVELWTLDRPHVRNCLSEAVLDSLTRELDRVTRASDVRAIVLDADGPVFSSGHDLKELMAHRADTDRGASYFAEIMARCAAMMQAMVACPKPIIAAVEGVATAAGCQLIATADLAVAGARATFATPGVNIGLFCSTPMVALSRNVSRKKAMEMLLLGEMLDAQGAEASGLVNRVVETGAARSAALDLADRIAAKSGVTVAIGKSAFYRQLELPLADAYTYASAVMVRNMLEGDAIEGIDAFITKRVPQWRHA